MFLFFFIYLGSIVLHALKEVLLGLGTIRVKIRTGNDWLGLGLRIRARVLGPRLWPESRVGVG